ncbi:MAG TPA: hypothetical protein VFN23_08410, partial [Ktedonobacteraceae bacterium]|nr:hypothetical protein [Ktedonobacteraceae bacterium]
STTRSQLDALCRKLGKIHAIAQLLATKDADRAEIVYDLLTSAATDPLALYYEVDRLIEQNAARARGKRPEYQAIDLSARVAPLLAALQPKEGDPV